MLKVIQVGTGGWGRDWAKRILQPDDAVELVACVDSHAPTLELARTELDLAADSYFDSLAAALAATDADAVVITANLPGHVPVAVEALNAGKHVLLEKPFAPTVAEAQAVVELAAKRERILMISQNYRFFPAVQAVRDLLRGGGLGEIGAVSVDFRRYANDSPREGNRHYALYQPLLSDMSIHHFDLMRAVLAQEPIEIACHAWNPSWSNFSDPAAAFATITFDGGAVVSYRGSWVSPGPETAWAGEWRIECAGGEIEWTSRDNLGASVDSVTVRPLGKRTKRLKLPEMPHIDRSGSLHAFAQAVASGQQPESSGRDNLNSLILMHTAIESATQGIPLKIERG